MISWTAVKFAVSESDGVIVQLPLPSHVDTDAVLDAIASITMMLMRSIT
jgi:hypothetical protein